MKTENVSTLKIHKLTQEQYDRELATGNIDETALYLTPDEEIDLSPYATIEQLNTKADSVHSHDDMYYTEAEMDSKLDTVNASISNITSGSVSVAKADEAVRAISAASADEATHATSADSANRANNAAQATKDASGNVITDTYETKADSQTKLDSAKSYTDTKVSGLASTSTIDNKISTHNSSTSAHNDIRDLINGLTTRLNTLADSDDTTLDQMSEIVEYIKANKTLIDSITTSKVNVSDIVNNLTTNVTNKPLSAAQGVAIKALIDALQTSVDGKAASSHTHNYAGSSSAGGSANSAVKWSTARNINGMSVDGSANRTNYGSCSTAAGTAAKTVDCTGFALVTGAEITVKFTVSNAAANPTLNVNSTGAKPIFYRGAAIDKSYLVANRTYTFRYDGTNWDFVGDINVDTNTDTKVTQTNTTTSGDYRVLFSGTADDTSRAESARKSAKLKYNPSTGTLSATEFLKNGNAVATTADLAKIDGSQTLSTSILELARTLSDGIYDYRLAGSEYKGDDLPKDDYAFGTATVRVRNGITVILWGNADGHSEPLLMCVNMTIGESWSGWKTVATTEDLANYLPLSDIKDDNGLWYLNTNYITSKLLTFARGCKVGVTPINTGADLDISEGAPESKTNTGLVMKRAADQGVILLFSTAYQKVYYAFFNSGSTTLAFDKLSTVADLANYLPLSGGHVNGDIYVTTGDVTVGNGEAKNRAVKARSNTRLIGMAADCSSSGSGAGIYDFANNQWILKSCSDEAVEIPHNVATHEIIANGLLKSYANGCYLLMGAQNGSFCHMYSDLPFFFNKEILINGSKVLTAADFTVTGSASSATLTINLD